MDKPTDHNKIIVVRLGETCVASYKNRSGKGIDYPSALADLLSKMPPSEYKGAILDVEDNTQ